MADANCLRPGQNAHNIARRGRSFDEVPMLDWQRRPTASMTGATMASDAYAAGWLDRTANRYSVVFTPHSVITTPFLLYDAALIGMKTACGEMGAASIIGHWNRFD
jgi:hypothetical protein